MKRLAPILLTAAVLAACSQRVQTQGTPPEGGNTATGAPAAQPAHVTSGAPAQASSVAHPTGAGGAGSPATAAAPTKVTGTVLEAVDASAYTYLRLKTAQGETWAAVTKAKVTVGATVTVVVSMVAESFESKSLGRTFDRLVMGTIEGPEGAANPHAGLNLPGSTASADEKVIAVPKAEGPDGHTVAEVWASRTALKDHAVSVRGRVVKFLPSIMGKNWLHLQDASGSKASGDNDITVTTSDTVAAGDVVLVKGTVRIDKDFGAGYSYPVIIEEARVSRTGTPEPGE